MPKSNQKAGALQEIQAILEIADEKTFSAGEMVFNEGDTDSNFYIILKGEVEIQKKTSEEADKVLAQVGPGEFLGEGSLSGNEIKPASAKAVTDVIVMSLSQEKFQNLIQAQPKVAVDFLLTVLGAANSRLSETNSKLLAIYEMSELTDMYGDDLKNLSMHIIEKLIALTSSNAGLLALKNPFSNDFREIFSSSPELALDSMEGVELGKTQKISNDAGHFLLVDLKTLGVIILKRNQGTAEYDTYHMRLLILIADLVANNIKEASEQASEKAKKLLHQRPIEL